MTNLELLLIELSNEPDFWPARFHKVNKRKELSTIVVYNVVFDKTKVVKINDLATKYNINYMYETMHFDHAEVDKCVCILIN